MMNDENDESSEVLLIGHMIKNTTVIIQIKGSSNGKGSDAFSI